MGNSSDALGVYNSRTRFISKVSIAIAQSDEKYKRRHLSEAQLKAIAMQATGGNFHLPAGCSTCTKRVEWLAAQVRQPHDSVASTIQLFQVDGYPLFPTFEVNQANLAVAAGYAAATRHPIRNMVLYSMNAGAWLFPLLRVGKAKTVPANYVEMVAFIRCPEVQAEMVARTLDDVADTGKWNLFDLARYYAKLIDNPAPEAFAVGVYDKYIKLIKDGHTEDL